MSANASTRYRVGIATKPILGRQAEHLEFDYRIIGKKFHNMMLKPIQGAPADHWPLNRASQQSQITPSPSTMS